MLMSTLDRSAPQRPQVLIPLCESIPAEMIREARWVVWRNRWNAKAERWVKEPVNAKTGKLAKSNDPATWCDFETAWAAYQASLTSKNPYSGVGFMLGDGWVGIDIDGCRDPHTGVIDARGIEVLRRVPGYAEVSPSRTGAKIICRGSNLPPGRREWDDATRNHVGVAIYDKGRYFAITGHVLPDSAPITDQTEALVKLHADLSSSNGAVPGKPPAVAISQQEALAQVSDIDETLLQKALASNDAKFRRLWNGDQRGYSSPSEADEALVAKIVFWFSRDPATIDAVFRRSSLMREKWDRDDYRLTTIAKALAKVTDSYKKRQDRAVEAAATFDLGALPISFDTLNALSVLRGQVRFVSAKRKDAMIIAVTDTGDEIVWPSLEELGKFDKSRELIGKVTGEWIISPPGRRIRSSWDPFAYLMLKLSSQDCVRVGNEQREETRSLLRQMWSEAGQPHAKDSGEFIEFVRQIRTTRRDHNLKAESKIPPVVFTFEEACWVHVPSLRRWVSIPKLGNRQLTLKQARDGLLLLDFEYQENVTRGHEGDDESACLWRGPLDVLEAGE